MREKTKDVEVGGRRYQIRRMDARVGSWISMQVLTKLLPFNIEAKLGFPGLSSSRSQMSEEEFRNIQDHCLQVCDRWEDIGGQPTPMPLLMASGVWALPDLAEDIVAVMALTAHALIFNLAPFFEEGALSAVMKSFPDLSSLKAPK